MAKRTINPKTLRGGVPSRTLPVRPVAPRTSASIGIGNAGSISGAMTPRLILSGRGRPPRGMAG